MLIFGIDKFMSECRALVNFTGNAVATLFIAWWDRTLDADRARRVFAGETVEPMPGNEQSQLDGASDLDDELSEYSRRALEETDPRHAGQAEAVTPARNRTPAYSETV